LGDNLILSFSLSRLYRNVGAFFISMITELKQYWTAKNGNRQSTRYIVIHHAAAIYAPGKAVQAIYEYHRKKWPAYFGIAYHLVCQEERDSSIKCYLVNPPDMQGAGVANRNHETFHICLATNFANNLPEQRWIDAAKEALAYAQARYPQAQVVGHKDIALPGYGTTCPGGKWNEWKDQLTTNKPVPPDSTLIKPNVSIAYENLASILTKRGIVNADTIARAYTVYGTMTGIGNVYPVAQALITSNNFTSASAQVNNPAHVGTNGFASIEEGILVHYAHLLAYATTTKDNTPLVEQLSALTPRYDAVVKAYGRGVNKTWTSLSGKWVQDKEYGEKIIALGKSFL
jgi:hypothetical protein